MLSLVALALGDSAAALSHARQACDLAQELGDWEVGKAALLVLGDALTEGQEWDEAAVAYQEMADRARELGEISIALEAQAGLARVAWAQGDHPQAQTHVDEIVTHLEAGGSLDGAFEPFRIYLTCFQVLETSQDDRAATVLASAYRQLQAQAAQIGDEELRRSFLENVAAHRELAAAVERVFPDGLPPAPEAEPAPAEPVEAITPVEAPAPAMPEPAPEAVVPAEVTVPVSAPAAAVPVAEPALSFEGSS